MDGWLLAMVFCLNAPRTVTVDLSDQTLTYRGECRTVVFVASTGAPGWDTPVGTFDVDRKDPLRDLSSQVAYVEDVPWIIEYDRPFYIHGAYWHDDFGKPVSHGCVNLRVDDAQWLYEHVQIGDRVTVQW